MHRRWSALAAAALTVTALVGASAAEAAPASHDTAPLTGAAAEAHAEASTALGGIALPTASSAHLRAAAAPQVQSLHETVRVDVAKKRYDLRVESVGSKADPTRIELFLGATPVQIAVRRLVRFTVVRHGHRTPLLEATTTYRRFVVIQNDLVANPLLGTRTHFTTRSAFVAALARGLALPDAGVTRDYGAALRFTQMSLDLSATMLQAMEAVLADPTATDLSTVPTVQTTAGSGGYAGTVTLTGSLDAFTVTATNTTDGSTFTEAAGPQGLVLTYSIGGRTYTLAA